MGFSKALIFLVTFLLIAALVMVVRKYKSKAEDEIVVYSLGFSEFEEQGNDNEHEISGLLKVLQFVKKAEGDGNLTVVSSFIIYSRHRHFGLITRFYYRASSSFR